MNGDPVVRLRHAKRWAVVHTATVQSVAEHVGLVALYSMRIADAAGLVMCSEVRALMLEWALWHDMPEVFTGDIPTPAKEAMGELDVAAVERRLCPEYATVAARVQAHEQGTLIFAAVKLADLVEAVLYLETDGLGHHAARVRESLTRRVECRAAALDRATGLDFSSAVSGLLRPVPEWADSQPEPEYDYEADDRAFDAAREDRVFGRG